MVVWTLSSPINNKKRLILYFLLFCGRDIRSQLERALQKAEAHRVDELSAIARADQGEKDKADLEAR